MSYTKIKAISINEKKNKITICGASSNVSPITYSTFEFMSNEESTFKDKMKELLRSLNGGDGALNTSCYKWNYALMETNKEIYGKENTWQFYEDTKKYDTNVYYIGNYNNWNGKGVKITETDLTSDFILDYECKDYKTYYKTSERQEKEKQVNEIMENYYNTFMKYFNMEHNGEYYLNTDKYGVIEPKGTNGSFYYYTNINKGMDFYKAYCLAFNCKRDNMNIEIKKIPTREYQATEKQEKEIKERLAILGLSKKDKISGRFGISDINKYNIDLIGAINDFEKEYKGIVYHIIKTNTNFGELYTMLYVSKNEQEWEEDKNDLRKNECYAYVYNKTNKLCSEIGLVGINKYDNCLERVY